MSVTIHGLHADRLEISTSLAAPPQAVINFKIAGDCRCLTKGGPELELSGTIPLADINSLDAVCDKYHSMRGSLIHRQ